MRRWLLTNRPLAVASADTRPVDPPVPEPAALKWFWWMNYGYLPYVAEGGGHARSMRIPSGLPTAY